MPLLFAVVGISGFHIFQTENFGHISSYATLYSINKILQKMREMERKVKKSLMVITLIVVALTIASVSAYVYESAQSTATQTVRNIATLTVQNSAVGDIEEGQTLTVTKTTVPSLGNSIALTTTKDNVYLHISSDIGALSTYYSTYTITAKYAAVPTGSSHSVGDVAGTITLASPNLSSITLDKAGSYSLDLELTTTAKSVSADQATAATLTVTAEST